MKTIKIQGHVLTGSSKKQPLDSFDNLVSITEETIIQLSQSQHSSLIPLDTLEDNSIFELEFKGGFLQWLRADELLEQITPSSHQASSINNNDIIIAPHSLSEHNISFLRVLKIHPDKALATLETEDIISRYEQHRLPKQGLLQYTEEGFGALRYIPTKKPLTIKPDEPVLLFIHGLFTHSVETFGSYPQQDFNTLIAPYGEHVYFLEHHTVTQSPVANALLVTDYFPEGTRLHIISHSRGGLVGELLCQGGIHRNEQKHEARNDEIFTTSELQPFRDNSGHKSQYNELKQLQSTLQKRRYKVEKFIRVAAPMRGSLLFGSDLKQSVTVFYNLLSLLPDVKHQIALPFIRLVALTLTKKRIDSNKLPGMECMMPQSPIIRLLNRPAVRIINDLTVISNELKSSNGLQKTMAWLTRKTFFQEPHDMIINTTSVTGGCRRVNNSGRYAFEYADQGIHHFEYFTNDATLQLIHQGLQLTPNEIEKPFLPIWNDQHDIDETYLPTHPSSLTMTDDADGQQLRLSHRSNSSTSTSQDETELKPTHKLWLIPDTMGSVLSVGNSGNTRDIWLDMDALSWGDFTQLRLPDTTSDNNSDTINASQIISQPLDKTINALSTTHHIQHFPWDWRKSHTLAADQLAHDIEQYLSSSFKHNPEQHNVRLLAHGSGGLIVLSLRLNHPKTWNKLKQSKTFRSILVGTPIEGSHVITQLLLGKHRLVQLLAMLSQSTSQETIVEQLVTYPGLLELLPVMDDYDYFSSEFWLHATHQKKLSAKHPEKAALKKAQSFQNSIMQMDLAQEPIHYIQGQARYTPYSFDILENTTQVLLDNKGDGFTRWINEWNNHPFQAKHIWHLDANHGAMLNHPNMARALVEIYENDFSHTLQQARTVQIKHQQVVLEQLPHALYPDRSALLGAALHYDEHRETKQTPKSIQISVIHGNLKHTQLPVVAGHYIGDSINNAEDVLDICLDGRLRELYRMGMYPGAIGTSHTLSNPGKRPSGALVIGMGTIGTLTTGKLTDSFTRGLIDFAIEQRDHISAHPPQTKRSYSLKLATLLLGSSTGGLSVQESMVSILRACLRANEHLRSNKRNETLFFEQLSFIEIYQDRAIEAAHLLKTLKQHHEFRNSLSIQHQVQLASGRLKRVAYEKQALWWSRIQVSHDQSGALKYTIMTERARAELLLLKTQRKLVDQFIETATRSIEGQRDVGKTLFELLVPNDIKNNTYDIEKLVVVVDATSANYPWELLENRLDIDHKPLSIRTGMLRQLQTLTYRKKNTQHNEQNALVIGNPPSNNFSDLPAAAEEAEEIHQQLLRHGFSVNAQIYNKKINTHADKINPQSILTALHTEDYRVLHLAGHGVYEYDHKGQFEKPVTGMILGEGIFLTPVEIAQMRYVPEFAFINCCHLGHAEQDPIESQNNRYKLAANLATELIKMGVRAVIAAGWLIDDFAAKHFAEKIYQSLLNGLTFGEAVINARQVVFKLYPETNTWGAYQCYGDPDYVLIQPHQNQKNQYSSVKIDTKHYVARVEVINDLENLRQKAHTCETSHLKQFIQDVKIIASEIPQRWIDSRVLYELGELFFTLGEFVLAGSYYLKAQEHPENHYPALLLEHNILAIAHSLLSIYQEQPEKAFQRFEQAKQQSHWMAQLSFATQTSLTPIILAKRRVLISPQRINAIQDLDNTAHKTHNLWLKHYSQINPDALFAWLSADALLKILKPEDYTLTDLLEHRHWMNQVKLQIDEQEMEHKNFNTARLYAEYYLVIIVRETQLGRVANLSKQVIKWYQEAIKRGDSPRRIILLTENSQLLTEVLSKHITDHQTIDKLIKQKRKAIKNIYRTFEKI